MTRSLPKHMPFLLIMLGILVLVLSACAPSATPTQVFLPISQAGGDTSEASNALNQYFDLLHGGQYQEAAKYFGGSYEVLQGYNPDLDPNDHAALWKNGCEFNGLRCLQIKSIVEQTEVSPTEYRFLVEFQNDDGSLFVLGPCCGADETEMPPISQFEYTVIKNDTGNYLVQELPVYTP